MARAVALLDGWVVPGGALASWHRALGPPLWVRGFRAGPELRQGVLAAGGGGGLCQVANLVYWLALHSGMEIVERHRHALDLFPDHDRSAPFGCGATVFFPTKDLRFRNPHPHALRLELSVREGWLHGRACFAESLTASWSVEESDHRFSREADGIWRHNVLWRIRRDRSGCESREQVAEHHARVAYPIDETSLPGRIAC